VSAAVTASSSWGESARSFMSPSKPMPTKPFCTLLQSLGGIFKAFLVDVG